MADPNSLRIYCDGPEHVLGVIDALMPQLPAAARLKLHNARVSYFMRYGGDGLYERVNGKTVAEVLAEYDAADDLTPVESGEIDGVRFALYEPPGAKDRKDEPLTDNRCSAHDRRGA